MKRLYPLFYTQKKEEQSPPPKQESFCLGNIYGQPQKKLIPNFPLGNFGEFISYGGNDKALDEVRSIIEQYRKGTLEKRIHLIEGPNGVGKTHFVYQIMKELTRAKTEADGKGLLPRYLDILNDLVGFNKDNHSNGEGNKMLTSLKAADIGFVDSLHLLINSGSRSYRYGAGNNVYEVMEAMKSKLLFLIFTKNIHGLDCFLELIRTDEKGNPDLADRISELEPTIPITLPYEGERERLIKELLKKRPSFQGRKIEEIAKELSNKIPKTSSIRTLIGKINAYEKKLNNQQHSLLEIVPKSILEVLLETYKNIDLYDLLNSKEKRVVETRKFGAFAMDSLGIPEKEIGKWFEKKPKIIRGWIQGITKRFNPLQLEGGLSNLKKELSKKGLRLD